MATLSVVPARTKPRVPATTHRPQTRLAVNGFDAPGAGEDTEVEQPDHFSRRSSAAKMTSRETREACRRGDRGEGNCEA